MSLIKDGKIVGLQDCRILCMDDEYIDGQLFVQVGKWCLIRLDHVSKYITLLTQYDILLQGLYGLKQAACLWSDTFCNEMKELGFF